VITYRGRSAIREVGKAMGLSLDCVDRAGEERRLVDRRRDRRRSSVREIG
jgi:DNA polymerase III alpha subunit